MNLAASLGIGPCGLLLPGALDAYAESMSGLAVGVEATVVSRQRTRRNGAAARSVKLAIVAAARTRAVEGAPWESNQAIATRVGVSEMYVHDVLKKAGLTKKNRTPAEIRALLAEARRLLRGREPLTQGQVADRLGISGAYLSMLLKRSKPEAVTA